MVKVGRPAKHEADKPSDSMWGQSRSLGLGENAGLLRDCWCY